jgi:hypothetical protein
LVTGLFGQFCPGTTGFMSLTRSRVTDLNADSRDVDIKLHCHLENFEHAEHQKLEHVSKASDGASQLDKVAISAKTRVRHSTKSINRIFSCQETPVLMAPIT